LRRRSRRRRKRTAGLRSQGLSVHAGGCCGWLGAVERRNGRKEGGREG